MQAAAAASLHFHPTSGKTPPPHPTPAQVFRFATSQDLRPRSYCDFVPCEVNVTIEEEVVVKEVDEAVAVVQGQPVDIAEECFYIEWITKTCRIGSTLMECAKVKANSNDVYINRLDCCSAIFDINIQAGVAPQVKQC